MTTLTRRTFLLGTAGLLAGCGRGRETLRVFVYAGNHERIMREWFVPAFEKASGATAQLIPGWWDAIAKLKASPGVPPFDLMITDATQGYPAIKDGLFAELDFENVPNHRHLAASVLDNAVFRDRVGLPYPDSAMTLAYHRGLVDREPTAWPDLLRDDLNGKIALYRSFYLSLFTFAAMKAGLEGRKRSARALIENELMEVLKFARAHRGRVKFWWPTSTDMILALSRKECAAGNMHSPEMLQAVREEKALAAVVPDHDRAFVQVMWCVPKGTPRQRLAEKALDVLFSEEVQLAFSRSGSASAVLAVAAKVAAEDAVWRSIYPHTAEGLEALRYYPYETYAAHWDEIADYWDRNVLRRG